MPYNPARDPSNFEARQNSKVPHDPSLIKTHSDIIRSKGLGSFLPTSATKVNAKYGIFAPIAQMKDFSVRLEIIMPGNNLGFGFNDSADRVLFVRTGVLYVTFSEERKPSRVQAIRAGSFFTASRGLRHSYATDGESEAEVLVIESKNYSKNWQLLEDPTVGTKFDLSLMDPPAEAVKLPRYSSEKTREQALEMAASRGRVPARAPGAASSAPNANSAASIGINPTPMMPISDD